MSRLLLGVLSVASLLVSIAAGALWRRSYWWCDDFHITSGREQFVFQSDVGVCVLADYLVPTDSAPAVGWHRMPTFTVTGQRPLVTFGFLRNMAGRPKVRFFLVFPHWVAVGAGLVLPAAVPVQRRLRRSTTPAGFPVRQATCAHTPDRCPECGAAK